MVEKEKREAALARNMINSETERCSKGLQIMKMMGFKPGNALGKQPSAVSLATLEDVENRLSRNNPSKRWISNGARLEPIDLVLKQGRAGIGHVAETKRKLEEAVGDAAGNKRRQLDAEEFRERVGLKCEEKRKERQFYAIQKVCEKLDTERRMSVVDIELAGIEGTQAIRKVPLKNINVLWRDIFAQRNLVANERKMKPGMLDNLSRSRLLLHGTVGNQDPEDRAASRLEAHWMNVQVKDVELHEQNDEDPELDAFQRLSFAERLERAVEYLRREYRYCFWCKFTYADDKLDGCPGLDEDSHG